MGLLRFAIVVLRLGTRLFARAVAAVALAVLAYVIVSLVLAIPARNASFRSAAAGVPIYVFSNGIHCDLYLPARAAGKDWLLELRNERFDRERSRVRYLRFGWGDRGFYLETQNWSDLKALVLMEALFKKSPAVLHVEWADFEPLPSDRCLRLVLEPAAYLRLADRIAGDFVRDESGKPRILPGRAYSQQDAFYDAKGSYSIIDTCNTRTAGYLEAAGVRTPFFASFAAGLLSQLRQIR